MLLHFAKQIKENAFPPRKLSRAKEGISYSLEMGGNMQTSVVVGCWTSLSLRHTSVLHGTCDLLLCVVTAAYSSQVLVQPPSVSRWSPSISSVSPHNVSHMHPGLQADIAALCFCAPPTRRMEKPHCQKEDAQEARKEKQHFFLPLC